MLTWEVSATQPDGQAKPEASPAATAAFFDRPADVILAEIAWAEAVRSDALAVAHEHMLAASHATAVVRVWLPPGFTEHVHLFRYDPGTA